MYRRKRSTRLETQGIYRRYRKGVGRKESVFTVASTVSQVALAVLAVFGYFFTVRPFHQNQVLLERNAQLEQEQQVATSQAADF